MMFLRTSYEREFARRMLAVTCKLINAATLSHAEKISNRINLFLKNWCYSSYYKRSFPVPIHEKIEETITCFFLYRNEMTHISYYQWVPFVLALEALMFYIPCILWRGLLHWHSGIDVQNLTQMACDARMMDADARGATVQTIAGHMEDALEIQREVTDVSGLFVGRRWGSYVTWLYIFIKLLYLTNVVGQIFLLNWFLGTNNVFYGFVILTDLMQGKEWKKSGNFPRVTMCDFEVRFLFSVFMHISLVRVLGNVHHHTVQCVLMINMFNEKIFLFLWFCGSLSYLTAKINVNFKHMRFIRKYLRATDLATDRQSVKKFVHKFLGFDGVFCMRMISAHAGDIIATELIVALWHDFNDRVRKSPVEMFEGGVTQSPTKLDATFKSWLLGQNRNKPPYDGGTALRNKKRRKSDGYFTFV
ncbi:unnamed protein product [Enterobius vermicularis]|uniref:Innexin n=1 Tax=Enterobius vermicularis TaxID=51028 RepID=A0A0N4VGB9_ENTVE|nr:unnamed protein product [Enterobius vermicularis]